MNEYNKITALYSRLSVGDEDRDGGESNSIVNQKAFLERYAQQQRLTNIRHYIDDDESGRFFDRSAYSRMMEDVENGKIGVCIMKDLTRWGRDYLQVGNAMEVFRRNNVRFIAVNNGIDSDNPDTLEFAPFINIMSEWYAKDISKKVKTGIRTKGASGKPIATEAPYGYMKDPNNKDFWIIDEEAAEVVRLIFRLFIGGKNRNQIAVYLKNEQILTPTFYLKQHDRGTAKSRPLNEENRYKWNKATLTKILTRQEYCGDVVNFKTTKHFRDKRNHYVDKSEWQITENVHEPIIDRADFETVQRILENAPVRRPNGDGEIHPLSGLMFCKDCGAKMHIRIDYRNGGKRHVAFCSEYHKGKAKNPKCNSPHIIDADLVMQTIADVLKKVAEYSISNREEFEALVRKNLDMQQTDKSKKQQKRIPQITTRLEQIDKVLNKLYEDMDWNRQENADLWRKAWADLANDYLERSGSAERIDHRSHAERGIEELPTVHMGVAASQMEKKGIATDKGEINRMIQKTNRLMREIRGYIDSLKEWLAEVFAAKKQLQAAPHSPDIATLLTRYLSIEREKSRKYSQGWQQQHTAGELQKISKAIVYLQSKGIATLEDLDAALSSVDEEAKRLNTSVVAKQKRMRTLEKFIEHGSNYNRLKPIHDELKTLKNGWGKKREKFEQAHESDLIIWNAANRFLHANLPEGTKSFKVSEWQKEFDELKAQSTGEYEELKTKRSEVKELQQIRKCIDIVEQAEQRTQEQTHQTPRRKKEDISL